MSEGFSADWLALREPYDARARSTELLERLVEWRARRGRLRIADLGAGTGANLRRMAPALGGEQDWKLVELDGQLIKSGVQRLDGTQVDWCYSRLNLAHDLERLGEEPLDLITASALIDLVSAAWLYRLVELRRRTDAALYVTLTYVGGISWTPCDPFDEIVADLVNRHQFTDKGFGPSLGPTAGRQLQMGLSATEGVVLVQPSDWTLGAGDQELQLALLDGYLSAASFVSKKRAASLEDWGKRRRSWIGNDRSSVTVEHQDLLFLPSR